MQVNGHTLVNVEVGTTPQGLRIFTANLVGKRGKVLAGYVCGVIGEDGTPRSVIHVNGSNQRWLA